MIRLFLSASVVVLLAGCGPANKQPEKAAEPKKETAAAPPVIDTTPMVTGVGGIFFFSDNPAEAKEWYRKNLGLKMNDYGSTFESRNLDRPEEINQLQWSLFKKGSSYFAPSKKEFMINYTVQNMEGLVRKLRANGVTVLDSIATYDYGKFVHIMDTEGNKIELWEPVAADSTAAKTKK